MQNQENYTLMHAKRHVENYVDEQDAIMSDHYEAMECADCEAFLQLGIDAFNWLIRADQVVRTAIYSKVTGYDQKVQNAVETLIVGWLKPCGFALDWAKKLSERGYTIQNLEEFTACCVEANAIAESLTDSNCMPNPIRALAKLAIKEHGNGETAPFVPG